MLAAGVLAVFAAPPERVETQEPAAQVLLGSTDAIRWEFPLGEEAFSERVSQKFRTGPNPQGYRLGALSLPISFPANRDITTIEAKLYSVEDADECNRHGMVTCSGLEVNGECVCVHICRCTCTSTGDIKLCFLECGRNA